MIRALIIDDEFNAIKNLKWEIESFCSDIEVCDTFTNPVEAISAINYLKPDCVFLDIEMPEMDGFQLLHKLTFREFDLIITSAYDNYAIKAFKEQAVDYLLKPIDSDDLQKSVSRVRENLKRNRLGDQVKHIIKTYVEDKKPTRLAMPVSGKTIFANFEDILYCKSSGNYTEVYFKDNRMELLSKKLKYVETHVDSSFFRVHNSYLVNLQYITEYVKTDGHYLVLCNGDTVPISRSRKAELLQLLNA